MTCIIVEQLRELLNKYMKECSETEKAMFQCTFMKECSETCTLFFISSITGYLANKVT